MLGKSFLILALSVLSCIPAMADREDRNLFHSKADSLSFALGFANSPDGKLFRKCLDQIGSDAAYTDDYLQGMSQGLGLTEILEADRNSRQALAYDLGIKQGATIKAQLNQISSRFFGGDKTARINYGQFLKGYTAHIRKQKLKFNGKTLTADAAADYVQTSIAENYKKTSAAFLADRASADEVKELQDGILYRVVLDSNSREYAELTDTVVVKYEGKLPDGTVFDSSHERENGVMKFPVDRVISGWTKVLLRMPLGATWVVYLPADEAYGKRGAGQKIPPYSALEFRITLKEIIKSNH